MRTRESRHAKRDGAALVITLGVLAVLLILVMGFAISMRTEQAASRNFTYVMSARQLAQGAVDEAILLIKDNTPIINDNTYYVTQAGRAKCWPPRLDPLLLSVSGLSPQININADRTVIPPNNNFNTAAKRGVWVDWVNVCENGLDSGAPLIGRYAFWVDDEASKININAAKQREYLPGATTQEIDLRALNLYEWPAINITPAIADASSAAAINGFFSAEHWKDISGIGVATFTKSAFYLTAFSKDTPLTPWGDARVDLNSATHNQIVDAMKAGQLATWFPASDFGSQNFEMKYGVNGLKNMAARIIDFRDSNSDVATDSVDDPTYAGLEETPYINEIAIQAVVDQANFTATISAQIELINPYSPAKDANELIVQFTIEDDANSGLPGFAGGPPASFSDSITVSLAVSVPADGYNTAFSVILYQNSSIGTLLADPLIRVKIQKVVLKNGGGLCDFARDLVIPATAGTSITVPRTGTVVTRSIEANDPRANDVMTDAATGQALWFDQAVPTLGSANAAYNLGVASTAATDLTSDGSEPSSSPVEHSNYYIKNAPFESVGELGYIHTGRPWRSLRLQPRAAGTQIPDWVVLDLFSTGPMIGRININSEVFHLPAGAPAAMTTPRHTPFIAAIGNVSGSAYEEANWPNNSASKVATNSQFGTAWAPTYSLPNAGPWTAFQDAYALLGQLCEVDKVANEVRPGLDNTDANREKRISQIIHLLTLRSNTFTIWALAQSIKDVNQDGDYDPPPGGNDIITGEVKVQAIVERYEDAGQVKFRTKYFRYIYE